MVTKYGLSEELGPMTYSDEEDEVFLGRSVTQHKHVSEETARKIDEVVRGVIDRAYNRAEAILTANMPKLEAMAGALLQYETIDRDQIAAIMAGREPDPPKDWRDPKPRFRLGHRRAARRKPDRRARRAAARRREQDDSRLIRARNAAIALALKAASGRPSLFRCPVVSARFVGAGLSAQVRFDQGDRCSM